MPGGRKILKRFFTQRWFLITLAFLLAMGYAQAENWRPLAELQALRYAIVASVLFIMALPLRLGSVWEALRRPRAVLLACGINYVLLPLVAWAMTVGLQEEMAVGLMVVAATPSTLASAAVWTRRAGGNDAIAIVVTVVTNLSCFVMTPLWLFAATGLRDWKSDMLGEMVVRLGLLVVFPMVLAQLLRLYRPITRWSDMQKSALSVLAQCGILTMVLLGAIKAGNELNDPSVDTQMPITTALTMLFAVIVLHCLMLWAGHWFGEKCGLSRPDRIAVGFSGSQKTLVVGLHVAVTYFGGLAILPMVAYHIGQLLIDALVADRLRQEEP